MVRLIGGFIICLNSTWDRCGNDRRGRVTSPNGLLHSILFQRECGSDCLIRSYSDEVMSALSTEYVRYVIYAELFGMIPAEQKHFLPGDSH